MTLIGDTIRDMRIIRLLLVMVMAMVPMQGVSWAESASGDPYTRADGNTVWPAGGQPAGTFFSPTSAGRIEAATPTLAAIEVSRGRFPADGTAQALVLTRNDEFADALSGSSLTGYGPLLFTDRDVIVPEVQAEIDRVLAADGQIWILGGVAAVSSAVENELSDDHAVVRLGGADRVETSLRIADHLWAGPFSPTDRNDQGMAIITRAFPRPDDASGTSAWADAIGAAAPAAARRIPVLLMDGDRGDPRVNDWLNAHQGPQGAEAVVLGGYAAISQQAEDVLTAAVQRYRVAGNTRAGTTVQAGQWGNAWTAHEAAASTPARFLVIDGFRTDGWAWGLAAAGIAADTNARLLLASGSTVPTESLAAVTTCGDGGGVALLAVGPETVVTADAVTALRDRAAADCAAEDVNAGTLCNSIPVAAMNDLMNNAWGVNEPILGGADVRLIEDRGEHDCTYRVDYLNATATGLGFAAVPSQWSFSARGGDISPDNCTTTPGSRIESAYYNVRGYDVCAADGFVKVELEFATEPDAVFGQRFPGQLHFDSLVLDEQKYRYPVEDLLGVLDEVLEVLPHTDALVQQVTFPR